MKKKKQSSLKKAKKGILLSIFLLFITIGLCLIFLTDHLFKIRTTERLANVKDYKEFILSVEPVPFCENKIITFFQTEEEIFNGYCINSVSVHYGSTKIPLKRAIEEGLLTTKDIIQKMNNEDEIHKNFVSHYSFSRSIKENENYRLTVSQKYLQTKTIQENTFEIYQE